MTEQEKKKRIHGEARSLSLVLFKKKKKKNLAHFTLSSLKIPSRLSFFVSSFLSFRLYVQRILFLCQLFQHTKHCSTLCTIYQRPESPGEPRFGLDLGLAALPSQMHLYITHCRDTALPSCRFLCLVVYH